MKKTLLTALLGIGLVFGAGNQQVKAQQGTEKLDISFYDKNENGFPREIVCNLKRGLNEQNGILKWNEESGSTLIGYYDTDNTNFYEIIKILNFDDPMNHNSFEILIEEKLKINEISGLIDYTFKKYHVFPLSSLISQSEYSQYRLYEPGKILEEEVVKGDIYIIYVNQLDQKTFFDLTEEKIYNISPELRDRVKNLIVAGKDAYKDKSRLEEIIKSERVNFK